MSFAEDTGQEVNIHLGGNGMGGGGVIDNGAIHQGAPEHSRTVHRYDITVRHVLVVVKGTDGASKAVVVVTGGT